MKFVIDEKRKRKHKPEALNLLTCVDRSPNTKENIRCCVSPVTCCMSVTPTATDPPLITSFSMQSRMILLIVTKTHQQ